MSRLRRFAKLRSRLGTNSWGIGAPLSLALPRKGGGDASGFRRILSTQDRRDRDVFVDLCRPIGDSTMLLRSACEAVRSLGYHRNGTVTSRPSASVTRTL